LYKKFECKIYYKQNRFSSTYIKVKEMMRSSVIYLLYKVRLDTKFTENIVVSNEICHLANILLLIVNFQKEEKVI
jgi:hypothetical protein